jgi:hypothetical protein
MSGINDRIKEVIAAATREVDRYKTLEEHTGINRTTWQNFMKGKQYANFEMIEAICRLWEPWALYMVIGKGERPDIDPERDTYYEVQAPQGGVTLKRDRKGGVITNVPHRINLREPLSEAEFEWGYHGTGPRELAANILFQFGVNEREARLFATEFSEEVLAGLPHAEAFISSARVREWIGGRLRELVTKHAKSNKAAGGVG